MYFLKQGLTGRGARSRLIARLIMFLVAGLASACVTATAPGQGVDAGTPAVVLTTATVIVRATALPALSTTAAQSRGMPTAAMAATASPTGVGAAAVGTRTPMCVSGYVTGGGDTTPEGLLDAPRRFVYDVKTDQGQAVQVTYRALPPTPNGERKIRLSFHAGKVLTGDYIKACGSFSPGTGVLEVAQQGDYIETYAARP